MGQHAFSTGASSAFGLVTGVLVDAIVIAVLGMGWQTDAYFIALTIPLIITNILVLQVHRVIQPIFISKRETEGEAASWNYLNLMITSGTAIIGALCVLGALLSPLLIRVQTAGAIHDEIWLASRLSVYLFVILPLYFPIVALRVALQSFGIFALTGAMKLFENTFKILFVLLLWRNLGVQALVLGTLAGVSCQVVIFYLVLRRKGFRFQPIFQPKHPDMIQAYNLMAFPLIGQVCAASVDVVNNMLGSMLGAGNVSALRLATRIIESFIGLLPASIVVAAMPPVAASVAQGDRQATKKHLQYGLSLLILVNVPLCVWLGLMNRPLIAFLYQRVRFSAADTALVANLLLLLIPCMLAARVWGLLELPFYAEQNTRTPLLASLIIAPLYVMFSLSLVWLVGIYALPIGRSLTALISPFLLAYLLRRRMGNLGFAAIRNSISRICAASLIMAAFIFLGGWLAAAMPLGGLGNKVIALGLPSSTGFAALVISLLALGVLDP